jgi:hypothetical protein
MSEYGYDDFGGSESFTSGAADRSAAEQVSSFQSSRDTGGDNDGGGQTFTRGRSLPGGGTQITGNKITGGRIISDTTIGRGDYDRNSQQYKDYLDQTGRSLQNPYGNTGIFSNIFGADKVNYNLDPTTAQNILDAGFQRFSNFEGQDELSQRRGFGKLFGGPEGEMTAQGEVRKQITPMSTQETAGRLLSSVMGLGLPVSMIEGGNVGYAPMGGAYDPQLDPQVNPDVAGGGGIMGLLTGGADVGGLGQTLKDQLIQAKDIITSKFSPPEVAAQQNQGPIPSFDPRQADALSQNMAPSIPSPAQEVKTMNLSEVQPLTQDRMMAAMLSGMDGASSASPQLSGISDPTASAKVYDLSNPGVMDGLEQLGVPSYKREDLQKHLDKGREVTLDSVTGKAQVSYPGTARGLSYDLSDDLNISKGFEIDKLMESVKDALSDQGISGKRVTGEGNFQEGPAFMNNLVSDASGFAPGVVNTLMNLDNPFQTEIGGGTLEFKPQGDLNQGLTGGEIQFNRPFQSKDMGIGNLFRMLG